MPTVVRAPFPGLGPDVEGNAVVAAAYEFPTHQTHVSKIMPGTIMPERECDENDMPPIEEPWHLTRGRGGGFGGGPRGGGGGLGDSPLKPTGGESYLNQILKCIKIADKKVSLNADPF